MKSTGAGNPMDMDCSNDINDRFKASWSQHVDQMMKQTTVFIHHFFGKGNLWVIFRLFIHFSSENSEGIMGIQPVTKTGCF